MKKEKKNQLLNQMTNGEYRGSFAITTEFE